MSLNLLETNSSKFLSQLEWPTFIKLLCDYSHFEENHKIFQGPIPVQTKETLTKEYELLDYYNKRIPEGKHESIIARIQSISPSLPFDDLFKKVEIESLISLKEISSLISVFEVTFEIVEAHPSPPKNLINEELKKVNKDLHRLIYQFRKFVSPTGEVDYTKHPELSPIYGEILSSEKTIRQTLQNLISQEDYKQALQFEGHDLINDHFVLAIRSDSYSYKLGRILAHSSSGQTLYVEPKVIKDLAEKREENLAKLNEIINKICYETIRSLKIFNPLLRELYETCLRIDKYLSRFQFCQKFQLKRPEISKNSKLEIYNFFHPLISNPVKNDLYIPSEKNGLIISGPNTGGKTVALKSICLCYLFAHSGLFLPADKAEIFLYKGLYYFANDQQNLEQGLSSFAGEVKNYIDLLKNIEPTSLIIIDEIFNSTSSEEASSLALGVMEEIHNRSNAKVLISTHHQMLKNLSHQNENYISAHVGFNMEDQLPTYELLLGIPGSSKAFAIFDKIVNQDSSLLKITKKAREIFDSKEISYEELLDKTSLKYNELNNLVLENKELNTVLKNQKNASEGILKLKMQDRLNSFEEKLKKKMGKLEQLFSDVKKGEITNKKRLHRKLSELNKDIESSKDELFKKENSPQIANDQIPTDLKIGKQYFYTNLNKKVSLLEFNILKNHAVVLCGKLKMNIKIGELRELKESQKDLSQKISVNILPNFNEDNAKSEVDCRGMRLSDFQSTVEESINHLRLGKVSYVNFIHGHGDGILKSWLRDHLKKQDEFEVEIPKHSQDGSTTIKPR